VVQTYAGSVKITKSVFKTSSKFFFSHENIFQHEDATDERARDRQESPARDGSSTKQPARAGDRQKSPARDGSIRFCVTVF